MEAVACPYGLLRTDLTVVAWWCYVDRRGSWPLTKL
jgi:hypothetical protein